MGEVVSYAQNREDLYIASFFPDVDKGIYVDIGAHHPILESVTKYFYVRGWTGINIEPQKQQFELFQKDRKRDINLNIGVSNKTGKLTLREYPGGGLSTFSEGLKAEYDADPRMSKVQHEDYEVEVRPLKDVLKEYPEASRINFMKIDVEGLEYDVIEGNDWKRYRPELICIEASHVLNDWRPLLKSAEYTKVFFDGLNDYYLANESMHRLDMFNYTEQFLAGKDIGESVLTYPTYKQIENQKQQITEITARAEKAEIERQNAEEARNDLERQLRENEFSLSYHARKAPRALKRSLGFRLRKYKLRGRG